MSDEAPQKTAARKRSPEHQQRVEQQPGFVLHTTPWRETSLIIDVFTRDFGRVALVARGAKRPTSQFRGLLVPFSPLALAWSGRHDIKTLVRIEWLGSIAPLRGGGLLAGFYLNELLVRLLARLDPHPQLFGAYVEVLGALANPQQSQAEVLRGFELDVLREIGLLPALETLTEGGSVEPNAWYRIDAEQGLLSVANNSDERAVRGATLLALAQRDFSQPQLAAEGKILLRQLIGFHLDGKPLNTRRIFQDLRRLEVS